MVISNKRGWLRVFEAVLAVLLILGAILLIYRGQQKIPEEGNYILDWQTEILSRIAENENLRNAVASQNKEVVNEFIEENLLPNLNFSTKICALTGPCPMDFYVERDIFVQERIISGTLEIYQPRKLRFFVWKIEN